MAADKLEKKEISEVAAFAREVHVPPRKARLVVDLVRNLPVADALEQLAVMSKKAALPVRKLVDSAVANAQHNFQIESDRLFIKKFTVDGGRVYKRFQPRAQGRAFPVRKRTSNLSLILGVGAAVGKKSTRKIAAAEKKKEISAEPRAEVPPGGGETSVPKKSRFKFWQKKGKDNDPSQLPPKTDPKGKRYTSFDRRGNM